MAATVKRGGVRKRRFPQNSTKHILSTPYNLQWPELKNGNNKNIIDEIVRTLVPLEFKQLCTKMPTASAEDSEEIKARIHEEQEERARKQQQRSSLVIGLNQVIRALEKGSLRLVLVDRSIQPTTLLEHLLVLCATRNAPGCALYGIGGSAVPFLLGVRRLAAFGFKNTDGPTVFDELVDFIKERIPPLSVPWLLMSKENSSVSGKTGDTTKEGDSDEEHLPGTFGMKRKRRRKSKGKKSELNKQTTTADSERLQEDTGKPSEKGCTGTPTKNTGKSGTLKLNRDELLAVFGTTNTAPSLEETDETKSKSEPKGKKRRRRRSKKNQGKRKIEHQLVYLRPLIKSFVTVPKDK